MTSASRTLIDEAARVEAEAAQQRVLAPSLGAGQLVGSTEEPDIQVYDDVLADPEGYRAHVLSLPFGDVTVGPIVFHGIAVPVRDDFLRWLSDRQPTRRTTLTFARQSPEGQAEPNYLHTDRDMGAWTAILYLTAQPDPSDGTTFWRHRASGLTVSTAQTDEDRLTEWQAWRDLAQWEPVRRVGARFNRAVIFPAGAFHSRAIAANYGHGTGARLIQVAFGQEAACQ